MRSGRMPSLIHQTESRERRPKAMEAKGVPGEDASGTGVGGPSEALTGEERTAEAVLDGERVAVDAVEGL